MTGGVAARIWPPAAAAAAILILGWFAGGQALLDRIDPALALPWLFPAMWWLARRMRGKSPALRGQAFATALLLLLAAQVGLAAWLGGAWPWAQAGLIAAGLVVAWLAAEALLRWRSPRRVLCAMTLLIVAALWFAGSHALLARLYRPPAAPPGASVTMMTSLPLRWTGGGDLAAMIAGGLAEDPALLRLQAAGRVDLVDSLADMDLPPDGTLLLAHPRALPPADLVAVDRFVRGGGRAVILADALSGWPVPHPLGDPRNPPLTSLLTPLFDHWGVTLAAADAAEEAPIVVDVGAMRLRLFSAGRFERLPPGCRSWGRGRVAHCPVGRGDAWLVGDADLLFVPLWSAPMASAPHLRRADTMEWIGAHLWGDAQRAGRLAPVWITAPAP